MGVVPSPATDELSVAPGSLEIGGGASREPTVYMTERCTPHNTTNSALLDSGGPYARLDTSLELLLEQFPADNTPRVLATAVATSGSTYRKSGARMLIMRDGGNFGLLSGGCLESDLEVHAQQVFPCALEVPTNRLTAPGLPIAAGNSCSRAFAIECEMAGFTTGSLSAATNR
jgi:hypothetical protein